MSREYKFRAVDLDTGKVYDVATIVLHARSQTVQVWESDTKVITLKNAKLLQYTGLKDKNGVEVYEGDIVRWTTTFNEQRPKAVHIDTIEWSELGDWMLMPFCHEPHGAEMEVIGNIYENPELLS